MITTVKRHPNVFSPLLVFMGALNFLPFTYSWKKSGIQSLQKLLAKTKLKPENKRVIHAAHSLSPKVEKSGSGNPERGLLLPTVIRKRSKRHLINFTTGYKML
jgi:hypothetical protein